VAVPRARTIQRGPDGQPRLQGRRFLSHCTDDLVIGCALEADTRRIMAVLPKRFARYGLPIHPTQTALMAFGKPAGHAGTDPRTSPFDVLGVTHYWTTSRWGFWVINRRTARKRLRCTKKSLWRWGRANRHAPLKPQDQMLCLKLRGHVWVTTALSGSRRPIACARSLLRPLDAAHRQR